MIPIGIDSGHSRERPLCVRGVLVIARGCLAILRFSSWSFKLASVLLLCPKTQGGNKPYASLNLPVFIMNNHPGGNKNWPYFLSISREAYHFPISSLRNFFKFVNSPVKQFLLGNHSSHSALQACPPIAVTVYSSSHAGLLLNCQVLLIKAALLEPNK